ncbi:MAG: MotA/TolQ/ExbB proton channel family protein [Opitutaceae bacterium]|nr:MotA/TolQ/ExbB proton channel family protein [Opitutaceae bacterium]
MTAFNLPLAFLMGHTPMELFKGGGPIMWPIIIVSFLAITVIIERMIFTIREALSREPEVIEKMLEKAKVRDFEGAIALGKKSKDFIARMLVYAFNHREQSLHNAFARAASREFVRYHQGMPTLDTCITAAPLLGLLGTITGMMNTFGALGTTGGDIASAAGQITGGVGEALIATAMGLVIAIVGLFPFNYLNSKTDEARIEVADVANSLDSIVAKVEVGN